jgi:NAD(P)-dependent dehydrogenase (short-subunit alcohol dehydrogenase family)
MLRCGSRVSFAKSVAALCAIDRLVDNAAIALNRMFLKLTPEDWKGVSDINLNGTFNAIRQPVPGMVEDGCGRIRQLACVKRLGTPEEIGSVVAWLAGEDSGFTTGADFSCNGGLHMG